MVKGEQWNVTRLACPTGSVLLLHLHEPSDNDDTFTDVCADLAAETGLQVFVVPAGVHVQVAPPGAHIEVENPLAEPSPAPEPPPEVAS